MAAVYTSMQQHANCCSSCAAGTTFALVRHILDTVILAVSISIIILGVLLINA